MAGVNKVILLGNLGADPEVKHLESGSVVARIRLATSESYKDKDGNRVDATEWHEVEMWNGLAKIAEQYLKQGDMIYLEGKIKSNMWQDDQGNNRKTIKIRANTMTMMPRKGGGGQNEGGGYANNSASNSAAPVNEPAPMTSTGGNENDIDDLPF